MQGILDVVDPCNCFAKRGDMRQFAPFLSGAFGARFTLAIMISALTIDQIVELLKRAPEQVAFDWKSDWTAPVDDQARGELIKDIAAIANASPLSPGFILYGVDPRRPDPVLGVSSGYDDAKLQQLVNDKIEPVPEFLYYEVSTGPKTVSVVHVAANKRRPFLIAKDVGRLRAGQIPIRRGSSTGGATIRDLLEMFYGTTSGYFPQVLSQIGVDVQRQNAQTAHLAELRRGIEMAEAQMWATVGLPGPPWKV